MRRVLIVAYYFPPIGGIGSIRLAGFAAHLPQFGWEPTVLAPASTPHQADPSIRFAESRVVRARSIEPALMLRRRRRGGTGPAAGSNGSSRAARFSMRSAIVSLAFPDAQIGWYPAAVAAARRLVDEESFDAVFSSSYPVTAHLVARAAARRGGLPWVAEFRDPWSERFPTAAHRLAARRLERSIVGTAEVVIVPSRAFAEHYGTRWKARVEGIPNGHDLDPSFADPDDDCASPGDERIVAHVGTYYPGRQSLTTVWQAIATLRDSGRKVMIRWVGELSAQARDELAAHDLLESVEVTGLVAHDEALALLRSSTMLIASGEVDRGPLGAGTTAAKLFEYVASGLPILYVCNLEADAAVMLGAHPGCYTVQFGDVGSAGVALEAGLKGERHRREVQDLSRMARAGDLAHVLDSVAEMISAV